MKRTSVGSPSRLGHVFVSVPHGLFIQVARTRWDADANVAFTWPHLLLCTTQRTIDDLRVPIYILVLANLLNAKIGRTIFFVHQQ